MNLDLTAAIEAAKPHIMPTDVEADPTSGIVWQHRLAAGLAAAAPLIAAQVAEQIAAAIASRRQSAETADEFDGLDAAEAIAREAVR